MKYFLMYLIAINIYGFFTMYSDKQKAIHKKWRTPEAVIFAIALAFGSPGVLMGMYTFRHKTKHYKFVIGIPVILVSQIYIYIKYLSTI